MNAGTQPILNEQSKRRILYGTGCVFELTKWIIVIVFVVILIHFFVATIAVVDGASMEPNFYTGEYILVNRFQYIFEKPQRGDAVVLKFPGDPDHKKYIKRIIGMPGERIEVKNGAIYINRLKLSEPYIPAYVLTTADRPIDFVTKTDEYFLVGDNRVNSSDSRIWGTASRRFLIGKAWFEFWPKVKVINTVNYSSL